MQVFDKSSFQIILEPDDGDNFSENWQDQCKYLYDDLYMALPEGSIKPLTLESSVGEKFVDGHLFSTISVFVDHLVAYIVFEALMEVHKNWSEYRPTANFIIRYANESITQISQELLSELITYSKENRHLSILEVLNHFKNFKR